MRHKYEWKNTIGMPGVQPPPGWCALELPAAPGSINNPSYPIQGTFRLEYRYVELDMDTRLWTVAARLMNLKSGMQSCAWHRDDIAEEPGVPLGDTVMKAYLDWARNEKEKATAMFLVMQSAWDALHPDDRQDRT